MRPDQEARALEDDLGARRYFARSIVDLVKEQQDELNRRCSALLEYFVDTATAHLARRDQLLLLCPAR